MVDFKLTANPVLGADIAIGRNRIVERSDLALVSVAVPLGGEPTLVTALQNGWGLTLPDPALATANGDLRAIRTAPDQVFLLFSYTMPGADTAVQTKLDGAGYTTDQTDAWLMLEISGPDTLPALERLCPLDLHPDSFPDGATGRTVMEHMGALILRLEADHFLLLSARSSARSFLHAVETSFRNVQI